MLMVQGDGSGGSLFSGRQRATGTVPLAVGTPAEPVEAKFQKDGLDLVTE